MAHSETPTDRRIRGVSPGRDEAGGEVCLQSTEEFGAGSAPLVFVVAWGCRVGL